MLGQYGELGRVYLAPEGAQPPLSLSVCVRSPLESAGSRSKAVAFEHLLCPAEVHSRLAAGDLGLDTQCPAHCHSCLDATGLLQVLQCMAPDLSAHSLRGLQANSVMFYLSSPLGKQCKKAGRKIGTLAEGFSLIINQCVCLYKPAGW